MRVRQLYGFVRRENKEKSMRSSGCLRHSFSVLSVSVLLLALSPVVRAQAGAEAGDFSYAVPERVIIQDVTVSGVEYIDPRVLLDIVGLRKGDTISLPGSEITAAVKKLNSQNLFSSVSINLAHREADHVVLDIHLQEQPRISRIEYVGVKRGAKKDLEEKLSLKAGQQATEATLDQAKRVIRKYYLDKGFLRVKVDARRQQDTLNLNAVVVTFVVDRGKKVKVKEIDFEGNTAFKDSKLRWKAFKKTKRINWNIFNSKKFIAERYKEDLGNLVDYYNKYGYRDAVVVRDSVYDISDKRVGIKVWLDEGNQYHLRDVKWVGNTVYPSPVLDQMLGMGKSDVYDQELLHKRLFVDENSVSTMYMDEGYLFFNIQPVETEVSNDSVTLEMRIMEGPQATISAVEILGNDRTNEHVIRRELRTYPGDLFSKTNIMRSMRELAALGYFNPETLGINPIPNVADGTVKLQYTVEEKSSDQLELSAGWGAGMFVGTLGLRFANFSIQNLFKKEAWRPIPSGDGQSLSIHWSTNGTQYQSLNLSFVEPWLGGRKPTSLSLSFMYSKYDYSKFLWNPSDDFFKIIGGTMGIGTRLKWPDDFFTIYGELSYQHFVLRNWRDEFIFSNGNTNNLSFKVVWGRNSVDQPIYPRSGSNFSLSLQLTPPYSYFNKKDYKSPDMLPSERYKWIEYHKWTAKAQWYAALWGDLVLYLGAHMGYLGYYNKDVGYSPFEGFDVGGDGLAGYNYIYGREAVGLRGYSNSSLTPRVQNGARMANIYDKFTMELRYPIILKPQSSIYVLLFAEGGNAWYDLNKFNPFEIHRSVGAGVRVFLPMLGMLGFDIAYGFDPVIGNPDANKWQPHFLIGMPLQ